VVGLFTPPPITLRRPRRKKKVFKWMKGWKVEGNQQQHQQ
jgi:hypothetical protein